MPPWSGTAAQRPLDRDGGQGVSPNWVSTAAQRASSSSSRDPAMHTARELIAVVRARGSQQFWFITSP